MFIYSVKDKTKCVSISYLAEYERTTYRSSTHECRLLSPTIWVIPCQIEFHNFFCKISPTLLRISVISNFFEWDIILKRLNPQIKKSTPSSRIFPTPPSSPNPPLTVFIITGCWKFFKILKQFILFTLKKTY